MKIVIPATLQPLAEAFAKENTEVFAVGGLVRNALLGLPPSDIDVCSRLTPEQIVSAAVAEDVHLVGISILSGSHMELVPEVLDRLRAEGIDDVPVIVGGIIPDSDARALKALGVAEVFTPKDFGLNDIMSRFVDVIREAHGLT